MEDESLTEKATQTSQPEMKIQEMQASKPKNPSGLMSFFMDNPDLINFYTGFLDFDNLNYFYSCPCQQLNIYPTKVKTSNL